MRHSILHSHNNSRWKPFSSAIPGLIYLPMLIVGCVFWLIPKLEDQMLDQKQDLSRDLVKTVWSMLRHLDEQVNAGQLTLENAQQQGRNLVINLRFGKQMQDYFWIHSLDEKLISHPFIQDENAIKKQFVTLDGKKIIPQMNELAIAQKDGFIDYYWQINGKENSLEAKTSFIQLFEPWGWVIGSGFYNSDVTRELGVWYRSFWGGLFIWILIRTLMELYLIHSSVRVAAQIEESKVENSHLSQIIEECMLSVVITDTSGVIQYVNPYAELSSGFKAEELIGQKANINKSGKTPDAVFKSLWETILAGKAWEGELINKRKDGSEYWEYAHISCLRDKKGTVTHFYAIKENISEFIGLKHKLIEAKEALENTERFKSRFLQTLTHEIRTPLNGISGLIPFLRDESFSNIERLEMEETIQEQVQVLKNLFDRILQVSVLQTSSESVDWQLCDLETILLSAKERALQNGQHPLQPGVELQLSISPEAAADKVVTDRKKLTLILKELLCNAIKYTESGSIIYGCGIDSETGERFLFVRDSGKGISEIEKPHIFELFHQGEDHFMSLHRGCGIGLNIVKRLVDTLQGNLQIESQLHRGTTLYVYGVLHSEADCLGAPLLKIGRKIS